MSQLVRITYQLPSTIPTAFNHPRGKGNEVEEKHIAEAVFYGAAFAIGCAAAMCRLVHERGHRDNRDLFAISVQGGLWSFGVIGVLGYYTPDIVTSFWFGLGVAALVGLGGKEQDKYLRSIIAFLWKKLGLPNLDNGNDEPRKQD